MPQPVGVSVTVNQRDINRITKRLDKWQGRQLAQRMDKAVAAGAAIFRAGLRAHAPVATGGLRASVTVKKLRRRPGEVAAYRVKPEKRVPNKGRTALLTAILVHGAPSRGLEPRPFVDEVYDALEEQVGNFITEQVRRLA